MLIQVKHRECKFKKSGTTSPDICKYMQREYSRRRCFRSNICLVSSNLPPLNRSFLNIKHVHECQDRNQCAIPTWNFSCVLSQSSAECNVLDLSRLGSGCVCICQIKYTALRRASPSDTYKEHSQNCRVSIEQASSVKNEPADT